LCSVSRSVVGFGARQAVAPRQHQLAPRQFDDDRVVFAFAEIVRLELLPHLADRDPYRRVFPRVKGLALPEELDSDGVLLQRFGGSIERLVGEVVKQLACADDLNLAAHVFGRNTIKSGRRRGAHSHSTCSLHVSDLFYLISAGTSGDTWP
jgi:hypothetical protein